MPRTARASVGGVCYHVLNRGNARQEVFLEDGDYETFLTAIEHACVAVPTRVLAYCLMPDHFHLVLWPREDGELSKWMHWLQNAFVRRYHERYQSSGYVWQGRFKAFPIQQDEHLLTTLRYVEHNPVRAKFVRQAENWKWSSARHLKTGERPEFLMAGPLRRPKDWLSLVNEAVAPEELESLRRCINRGAPFGTENWATRTAVALGLESTLRPRGRPRKVSAEGE